MILRLVRRADARLVDGPVECSARRHDRRVFGDIAETSTSHGLAFLGASHAMEEGVDDGSAARVCAVGDAGRSEPAGVVPALRDSPRYGLQVAGAVVARGDVAGRPLAASAHDTAENSAGDRTAGSLAARSSSGMGRAQDKKWLGT